MSEWVKAEDKLPPEENLCCAGTSILDLGFTTECFKHSVLDAITLETGAAKLQTEQERVLSHGCRCQNRRKRRIVNEGACSV